MNEAARSPRPWAHLGHLAEQRPPLRQSPLLDPPALGLVEIGLGKLGILQPGEFRYHNCYVNRPDVKVWLPVCEKYHLELMEHAHICWPCSETKGRSSSALL